MTAERQQQIEDRWAAIDQELLDLAEGKVILDVEDPPGREEELLEEQDALEFELGEDYFETRDAGEATI